MSQLPFLAQQLGVKLNQIQQLSRGFARDQMRLFGRPSSSNTQKVACLWHISERWSRDRCCGPCASCPPGWVDNFMKGFARPNFELVLASARLGDSPLLGGQPYGVVDTDEYARLNPTRRGP